MDNDLYHPATWCSTPTQLHLGRVLATSPFSLARMPLDGLFDYAKPSWHYKKAFFNDLGTTTGVEIVQVFHSQPLLDSLRMDFMNDQKIRDIAIRTIDCSLQDEAECFLAFPCLLYQYTRSSLIGRDMILLRLHDRLLTAYEGYAIKLSVERLLWKRGYKQYAMEDGAVRWAKPVTCVGVQEKKKQKGPGQSKESTNEGVYMIYNKDYHSMFETVLPLRPDQQTPSPQGYCTTDDIFAIFEIAAATGIFLTRIQKCGPVRYNYSTQY